MTAAIKPVGSSWRGEHARLDPAIFNPILRSIPDLMIQMAGSLLSFDVVSRVLWLVLSRRMPLEPLSWRSSSQVGGPMRSRMSTAFLPCERL